MGKRRSPQELIAEAQARVARLQTQAAMAEAKENPALSPIVERIEELKESQKTGKLGLGDGPQSYQNRIHGKQLWIREYEAREAYDRAVSAVADEQLDSYESFLSSQVEALTEGEDHESIKEAVSEFLETHDTEDEAFNDLRLAWINAAQERRAFSQKMRGTAEETE